MNDQDIVRELAAAGMLKHVPMSRKVDGICLICSYPLWSTEDTVCPGLVELTEPHRYQDILRCIRDNPMPSYLWTRWQKERKEAGLQ